MINHLQITSLTVYICVVCFHTVSFVMFMICENFIICVYVYNMCKCLWYVLQNIFVIKIFWLWVLGLVYIVCWVDTINLIHAPEIESQPWIGLYPFFHTCWKRVGSAKNAKTNQAEPKRPQSRKVQEVTRRNKKCYIISSLNLFENST